MQPLTFREVPSGIRSLCLRCSEARPVLRDEECHYKDKVIALLYAKFMRSGIPRVGKGSSTHEKRHEPLT